MTRTLSHTEMRALVNCEASWDLGYGDTLAGSSLKPKVTAIRLREGRAWGRAAAALHAHALDAPETALDHALRALDDSIVEDIDEQAKAGVYSRDEHLALEGKLRAILRHYAETTTLYPVTHAEAAFDVDIRPGWRFTGFLDGLHRDPDGHLWIVENKLRGSLSSFTALAIEPQGRRYAWAWEQATGERVAGVIYEERLNEEPRAPKILKSGKTSRDKAQIITAKAYLQSCEATGTEPSDEMVEYLLARKWQQRVPVIFRPGELEDVHNELLALTYRVEALEQGRFPIRTAARQVCGGCFFQAICPDPADAEFVEGLYARRPAKRNRKEEGEPSLVR